MKTVIFGMTLLLSVVSHATTQELQAKACEESSYQEIVQDFAGECKDVLLQSMKKNGCTEEEISKINDKFEGASLTLSHESTTLCKIESKNGVYQVMTSAMSEVPVAAVIFSKND